MTSADAEAVAALRRAVYPYKIMSADAARHMITVSSPAERFLALVAEVDGQVVAWGSAGLNIWTSEPGSEHIVDPRAPAHRRAGHRRARCTERLHSTWARSAPSGCGRSRQPDGLEFGERLGYDGDPAQLHYSGVDIQVLPEQPPTPDGIVLDDDGQARPDGRCTSPTRSPPSTSRVTHRWTRSSTTNGSRRSGSRRARTSRSASRHWPVTRWCASPRSRSPATGPGRA